MCIVPIDEVEHGETSSPDPTAFFGRSGRWNLALPITRDITGEEHYSTLYVIEVSPHDPDVIWDWRPMMDRCMLTRDGGATWTDVTPEAMPPERADTDD